MTTDKEQIMRVIDRGAMPAALAGRVEVNRWPSADPPAAMPFQAMWYAVPPATSSPTDQHPETELSLVISGRGLVEVAGRTWKVSSGNAFLLDSNEPHTVHNT